MPIRNEVGRFVSWVSVVQDITERKRAEEELRQLPRRIIEAQEAERLRVARELHDGVNQVIASVKMRLRKVESRVGTLNPAAREILARCDKLLVQALEENRRIAHDLRPSDLDELGLGGACRNFCQEFQARTNLAVKCSFARLHQRPPAGEELNLFRIVQEALTNVEKHAQARTVRLRLSFQRDSVVLRIQDDGRGFDPRRSSRARGKGQASASRICASGPCPWGALARWCPRHKRDDHHRAHALCRMMEPLTLSADLALHDRFAERLPPNRPRSGSGHWCSSASIFSSSARNER